MAIKVKILADSKAPNGKRLTTWELIYPRFIHAEVMTHRLFSRCAASSRAIPVRKLLASVLRDPATPVFWGRNRAGMSSNEQLSGITGWLAKQLFMKSRYAMVVAVWLLSKLGLHKQLANRLLEPWMHITVILTASEFDNWFRLRCAPEAQPEIQKLATHMRILYLFNKPKELGIGEYHLPYIDDEDRKRFYIQPNTKPDDPKYRAMIKTSVARCARVSYLSHDGTNSLQKDCELHDRLIKQNHMSPCEHVASALLNAEWSGNICGFRQYREEVDPYFEKRR